MTVSIPAPVKPEPTRLTELKTVMLLHVPFFASLLLDTMEMKCGKFPELFGSEKGTAATNGKTIWFDEDFLAELSLSEAVFVLCHEIGHKMWNHMSRGKYYVDMGFDGKEFSQRLWNIAGDYIINDMLVQSAVGTMPKVGLLDSKKFPYTALTEDVYRELMKNVPPMPKGGGQETLDKHLLEQPADDTSEAEMRRAVQSAKNAAKAQGKMPQALERFVDELLEPQVKWQELLRTTIARVASRDATTWTSPHRRRLFMQRVFLPSYTGFNTGELVVAVDTSGSIGQAALTAFFSELSSIFQTCHPERVHVLGVDAAVNSVETLEDDHDVASSPPKVVGGGGTAFEPAFRWVEEQGIEPAALIYFTDMYGSFPSEAPPYTTIWCSTSKGKTPPFGELIEIEIDRSGA